MVGPRKNQREREPHVAAIASLFVPQAGIIRFADVANKFAVRLFESGGRIHLQLACNSNACEQKQVILETTSEILNAKLVITCGGLWADWLARMTLAQLDVRILPFRGEYYALKQARHLVNHLIYPVPNPAYPFSAFILRVGSQGIVMLVPVQSWPGPENYRRTDFPGAT